MRPVTITCPVYLNSLNIPERTALKSDGVSISFGELERRIRGCAAVLKNRGVKAGDRLGVIACNSVDYATFVFAVYRIGATIVPISTRLNRDVWVDIIGRTDCKALIVDDEALDFAEGADRDYLVLSESGTTMNADLAEDSGFAVASEMALDSEASIVFTSGSEGIPRGVILTIANHYYSALASNENIRLSGDDCWLAVLPFYHVGGLAIPFRTALAGCSTYVMSRFDVGSVNRLIDDRIITHLSLVPAMLSSLLDTRGMRRFPDTLKVILLGGESAPSHLLETIRTHSLPVVTTYGMTEAASQVCTTSPSDPIEKLDSSGRPLIHSEVRILDKDGKPLGENRHGEIAVRGPIIFERYLGKTAGSSTDRDGWFRTGDMGHFDSDGFLHVRGRRDDMFISGGENIYPSEIERAVEKFPAVAECAVIAVESAQWGQRPVLFVRGIDDTRIDMRELRSYLGECLPGIQVPEEIIEIAVFPRGSIDKIDKERLREVYFGSAAH